MRVVGGVGLRTPTRRRERAAQTVAGLTVVAVLAHLLLGPAGSHTVLAGGMVLLGLVLMTSAVTLPRGRDTRAAVVPQAAMSTLVMLAVVADVVVPRAGTPWWITVAGTVAGPVIMAGLVAAVVQGRMRIEDLLDAGMLAVTTTYLLWWYLPAVWSGPGVRWALLTLILSHTAGAGLILLSRRAYRVPLSRRLVAAWLLGLVTAALTAGGSAAPTLGGQPVTATLLLLAAGSAAVGIAIDAVPVRVPIPPTRSLGQQVATWAPMSIIVLTFALHAGVGRVPPGDVAVPAVLTMLAALLLVTRIALTVHDLSATSERYRLLASTDPLTGLANRAAMMEYLDQALRTATPSVPVTLLFCDLDRLKVINDSLGHGVGDHVIRTVAQRWANVVGPDALLVRVGGDEFVVVVAAPEEEVDDLVDALHASLDGPIQLGTKRLSVRTSTGRAVATSDQVGPETLLRDADAALYRAKEAGGGTTRTFDTRIRADALDRLHLEQGLRAALEDDDIDIALQPIVDLATGRVVSLESLLRWRTPDGRVQEPEEVISVAEETGLIIPLGDLLLRRSCAALAALRSAGWDDVTMAVNTSVSQLLTTGFVDQVSRALQAEALPTDALVLEMTETVLLQTGTATSAALDGLIELGVGISMDDFGTGYSSLSYLSRLHVDQLKLDRGFMLDDAAVGTAVLRGVLDIADALGITVVAEGVETCAQAARVRDMGCGLAQGFAYMVAQPLDVLVGLAEGEVRILTPRDHLVLVEDPPAPLLGRLSAES